MIIITVAEGSGPTTPKIVGPIAERTGAACPNRVSFASVDAGCSIAKKPKCFIDFEFRS